MSSVFFNSFSYCNSLKTRGPKARNSDCSEAFSVPKQPQPELSAGLPRRLTGGITILPPESASKEMQKNYELAKSLIEYVGKTVLHSYNYLDRSESIRSEYTDPALLKYHISAIKETFSFIRDRGDQVAKKVAPLESIRLRAKIVEKYNVGNCSEMACVALAHAMDIKATQRVELCMIQHGDHIFLVIGRNAGNYPPGDYKKWGPDAYVCGPWEESCYPASDIESYLNDYCDTIYASGEFHTMVKPFNPTKQKLRPLVGYPGIIA